MISGVILPSFWDDPLASRFNFILHWFWNVSEDNFSIFSQEMIPKLIPVLLLPLLHRNVSGLREHSPNASAAPARFCIDLKSNLGAFFVWTDVVFGTRFSNLELAPPPNYGSWFASFSRVQRVLIATSIMRIPLLYLSRHLLFAWVFHNNFMFLGTAPGHHF